MKKRISILALALITLLSVFTSCKNTNNGNGDAETDTNKFLEINLSEYTIVYSKDSSTSSKKQATALQSQIKDALSLELPVMADKETAEQEKEILVGMTNRQNSTDTYKKITGRSYVVATDGQKIIITAYNSDLLSLAINYFSDTYLKATEGTTLLISPSSCYISDPEPATEIVKNGAAVYSVVRAEDASYNITECAKGLYSTISQLTGTTVTITTDFLKKDELPDSESFEILVGDTNRPETQEVKTSLKANEYAIRKIGNKIVIVGVSDSGTSKAKDAFLDIVYASLGQTVDGKSDLLIKDDVYKSDIGNTAWLLNIPEYDAAFSGIADVSNDAYELLYSDTSAEKLEQYCEKLTESGYTLYNRREVNGNLYCSYYKTNTELVYAYYTARDSSVRIIVSPYNNGLLPLSYTSGEKITEASVTQLKLDYDNKGNGMTYIITLEDGSFIVIDGGSNGGSNADFIHQKLQELNKRDGTPVIAAWYLTHIHQDHSGGFASFASKYGSQYVLEYAFHNLPTKYIGDVSSDGLLSSFYDGGTYKRTVNSFVGDAKTVRVHTGMKFNIHGAEFEVLHTWEDCYPEPLESQNDSSVVTKMTLNGKTFLWTGDIQKQSAEIILASYGNYISSDYLQVAHHGLANGGSWEFYRTVAPTVAFWPTSNVIFNEQSQGNGPAGLLFKAGTVSEHIVSEQGDYTVTLESIAPTPSEGESFSLEY